MPECYFHAKVESVGQCEVCGKPLCGDCISTAEGGFRCFECLNTGDKPHPQGSLSSRTYVPHFLGLVLPGLAQVLRGEPYKGVFLLVYFIVSASAGIGLLIYLSYVVSVWDYFFPLIPESPSEFGRINPRNFFGSILIVTGGVLLLVNGLENQVSENTLKVLASALTIVFGVIIVWASNVKDTRQTER